MICHTKVWQFLITQVAAMIEHSLQDCHFDESARRNPPHDAENKGFLGGPRNDNCKEQLGLIV